jgi:hypothetical protein
MALSLAATGYFIYLVQPWTPDAVVASVIVFNAAFGYRYDLLAYISHQQVALCLHVQLGPATLVVPARGELHFCSILHLER